MKHKILVVDDEPAVCDMLKKFLLKRGYKVITVLSGRQAISRVKRQRPHVVLLDIRMPDMDGIEVLKRIKEFDKKIPVVIMITAVKDDEIGRMCLELGASDYITKPLGLKYLEDVLTVKLLDLERR